MFDEPQHPLSIMIPPLVAPMPPCPPLQTLADLPQDEKDKVQRIVDKVVSLGHENDELRKQLHRQTQQHTDQLTEFTEKLHKTTGLLYLYQSTLESKLAIDSGSEYESLLREKQSVIDELRIKLEASNGDLDRTTARLLSRELEMENLAKQQQHDRHLLQESMERCSRMETACLSLTKQLTTQGFRLRHMQTMVKEQQQRTTVLPDKTSNRMCHDVSTQCVDVIERRNAAIGTVEAVDENSTAQHDRHVPSPTSSTSPHNKKVMVGSRTNHNEINSDVACDRDVAGKGKRTRTCKVLTMTGYVKVPIPVPVPFSTVKQPPAPLSHPNQQIKGDDNIIVQSPKKKKIQASGRSGVHLRWKDKLDHDDNDDHDDDNNTESAVISRGGGIRTATSSSSSNSNINMSSNAECANRRSHPQYASNSKDKHRVVVVTTAAVRRRPATTTRVEAEGMLGFPYRRRPLDNIENSTVSVRREPALSLTSSEHQATNRKIPSRQTVGSNSKTEANTVRQSPLHVSRGIFDGDYDAQLFVLLDNIEEQI